MCHIVRGISFRGLPDVHRPSLSDLFAEVNTYGQESGFASGLQMTKDLLAALYESPESLRRTLVSLSSSGQRDDAVAGFVRSLLESGSGGKGLLRSLPKDIKDLLLLYLGTGDAWSPAKDAAYLTLAKMTDPSYYEKALQGTDLEINGEKVRSTIDFNGEETMQFLRRYQGGY